MSVADLSDNSKVATRLKDWMDRLLDLSRRNATLYFQPGRRLSLRVEEPGTSSFLERFVLSEKAYRFWVPIEAWDAPETGESEDEITHTTRAEALRLAERAGLLTGSKLGADEIQVASLAAREVGRRLRAMWGRARTDLEERGVRILFAAAGTLTWTEQEGSTPVTSPLIMIPAELVRESTKEPFELRPVDEDIVLNPVLRVKLQQDFHVDIPDVPDDWDSESIEDYLGRVREAIPATDWVVRDDLFLGLFSFHKLPMYQDLAANRDAVGQHGIVRSLAGAADPREPSSDLPEPQDIDQRFDPARSCLVLDADSSQLVCIEAVAQGRDVVLHGPPGTGKSQTIANVIADSIAAGRTVLFVSEKMAALEVVHRRLKQTGLDHYCLELHSHKANKRAVISELHRCLQERLKPAQTMSQQELGQLASRHRQLREYVGALHSRRLPLGMSAFDALGALARLGAYPYVPVAENAVKDLTPESLARADELAHSLADVWHVALYGPRFPWFGCRQAAWSPYLERRLAMLLGECSSAIESMGETGSSCAVALGGRCETLADARYLDGLLRFLEEGSASAIPDPLRGATGRPAFHDAIEALATPVREHIGVRPGALAGWLKIGEACQFLANEIARWEASALEIARVLGIGASDMTLARAHSLVRLVEPDSPPRHVPDLWLSETSVSHLREEVVKLRDEVERYRDLNARLNEFFSDAVLDLDLGALVGRLPRYRSIARFLRRDYRSDLRSVRRCCKDGRLPKNWEQRLDFAATIQSGLQELDAKGAQAVGDWYSRYDTDFQQIALMLELVDEARQIAGGCALPPELVAALSGDANVLAGLRTHATELRDGLTRLRSLIAEAQGDGDSSAEDRRSEEPFWHESLGEVGAWSEAAAGAAGDLENVLLETNTRLAAEAGAVAAFRASLVSAQSQLGELRKEFDEECPRIEGEAMDEVSLGRTAAAFRDMADHPGGLRDWLDYRTVCSAMEAAGLADLPRQLQELGLEAEQIPGAVRKSILDSWLAWVCAGDPILASFRGVSHSRAVKEFAQLDRALWELGAARIATIADARRVSPAAAPAGSEKQALLREANKQRRHMPVRKLFAKMPHLLLQVKPCLLMSPLSVSQYLPPDIRFDLVIFDEASQICSEDAISAIYRGDHLLVCGDQKQLPPTMFFQKSASEEFDDSSEEEDDSLFGVFDSVLDECLASGMASSMLRWHYRSRHESLIAFSNDKFYGNRLVTFPSSLREDEGLGLKLVYVENGVYDRGKSHKNLLEARRVADLVHEHLCERPDRSVGVVTFSQAQMEAVEDELELRARDDRHFEDLMRSNEHEPFFVKNLENVQGDERDVIIFSIGYGRDAQGRMYMNFGPLNRAGGERRLNVAITRAREKVVLVSSIRASDLDISGTGADGVRVLHAYLDYAERGADALEMEDSGQGGEYESPLEEDVANAIKEMGYQVVPQVGCSGFRVDLGVIDPLQPGRYLLGVECDGASYHSGYVARDKDRIRQEILENLGWRIHRIWSPDWVTRRREEVERLRQALAAVYPKALFASAEEAPNDNRPVGPAVTIEDGAPAWTLASQDRMGADSTWAIPYAVCELSAGAGRLPEFLDEAARARQRKLLLELVQVEGPIHRELVKKRIAAAWGKQVGSRIAAVVDDLVDQARAEGGVEIKGDFVVLAPAPLISYARVPVDGDPRTKRGLEHIPNAEIAIVMLHLTEDGCGISEEGLVAETARVFGFKRTGEKIHDRLLYVVNGLVRIERLRRSGDNLYLP